MTYVDGQYISVARKNEMEHHEYTMDKLRAQVALLNRAVAWESEQHQARLNELKQVEDTLSVDKPSIPAMKTGQAVEPTQPVKRRRTKARKNVHLSTQESVPELVG